MDFCLLEDDIGTGALPGCLVGVWLAGVPPAMTAFGAGGDLQELKEREQDAWKESMQVG